MANGSEHRFTKRLLLSIAPLLEPFEVPSSLSDADDSGDRCKARFVYLYEMMRVLEEVPKPDWLEAFERETEDRN